MLQDPALYSPKYQVASVTKTETWKRATDSGSVDVPVYVHIYYDESLAHDEKQILLRKIDDLLEIKNKNLQAESDDWNKYKNYLIKKEVRNKENNCIVEWIRDDVKIRHTLKHSGFFVIRSNLIADALSALEIYRRRNIVEQAFNQYKNQTEGSRMYATQSTYMGKLFVHIIAQALRMTLYMNAKNTSALNSSLMLPNESLSRALAQLRTVMSVRSAGCNYWILRPVTKKQRDLLALLNLDLTKSKNRMVTH